MASSGSKILTKMLERLFASLLSGPALNCRPHSSRQRIDLTAFSRLRDAAAEDVLRALLGADHKFRLTARVPPAAKRAADDPNTNPLTDEEKAAQQAWTDQQSLLSKLKIIVDD